MLPNSLDFKYSDFWSVLLKWPIEEGLIYLFLFFRFRLLRMDTTGFSCVARTVPGA
jgi:hypothetical protein